MLSNRGLSVNRFQPIATPTFRTTYIIVFRRKLPDGHIEFDGPLGTSDLPYQVIAHGYPASIPQSDGTLSYMPEGETEVAKFRLECDYKQLTDGTLIIQERDVLQDLNTGLVYEVEHAYDPMNTHTVILADLKFGTIDPKQVEA